jgi:ribosomal protein S27E
MTMYLQDKMWDYDDIDCQFVVCQKCYWTATIFKKRNNQTIITCPICSAKNISAYSVLIHDNDLI